MTKIFIYKIGIKIDNIMEADFEDEIAIVNSREGFEYDIIDNS